MDGSEFTEVGYFTGTIDIEHGMIGILISEFHIWTLYGKETWMKSLLPNPRGCRR